MIMLIVILFKVLHNTEVEEGFTITLDRFCDPQAQTEIRKHIGNDFDAIEEFAMVDKSGLGEVRFDDLMNWVFKRSLNKKNIYFD